MVVILLILLNILFYFTIPYGYYNLLGLNILFFKGAYWQILSSMFMHGNLTHLILNMIVLFQFGRILESYLGALRFFLLYIIGGLMCSLLSAFYVYCRRKNKMSQKKNKMSYFCDKLSFFQP